MNPRTSPPTRAFLGGHLAFNLFSAFRRHNQTVTRLEVTGRPSTFTAFGGDPYSNDVFRAGVDAIARIAAKFVLQPRVTFSDGTEANADERLTRVLQYEPNPLMSGYDMLYMSYTHLYTANNAFSYLQREGGQVVAVWPLHVTSCELAQGRDGEIYAGLTFANGTTALLPYRDIVHLRRHFNQGDVLGDPNDAISAGVELADMQNQGIRERIKQGGQIRGLVKFTGALGPSKLAEYKKHFEESQLNGNSSGVILTDSALEFVPVTDNTPAINAGDVEATKAKIYDYLGISEAIVNASFNDDAFGAFGESVIEAIALQTSLEWTRKVYSPLQVVRGRRIDCSTTRISYVGTANKTQIVKYAVPMGVVSVNEARDLLGLAPLAEDRRIQSLNYASTELVDRYQIFNSGHGGVRAMNLPDEGTDDAQD